MLLPSLRNFSSHLEQNHLQIFDVNVLLLILRCKLQKHFEAPAYCCTTLPYIPRTTDYDTTTFTISTATSPRGSSMSSIIVSSMLESLAISSWKFPVQVTSVGLGSDSYLPGFTQLHVYLHLENVRRTSYDDLCMTRARAPLTPLSDGLHFHLFTIRPALGLPSGQLRLVEIPSECCPISQCP